MFKKIFPKLFCSSAGDAEIELPQITNDSTRLNKKIHHIMVQRDEINAIPHDATKQEIVKQFIQNKNTRMPVYKNNLDDAIGFVHIKDMLSVVNEKHFDLQSITRQILKVPSTIKVADMLILMKNHRVNIAMVLDEHGGSDGLITLLDIIEEIIGDIEDEHEMTETLVLNEISKTRFEIKARMPIEDAENMLNIKINTNDEDVSSIGGLIFNLIGRIPVKGETIKDEKNSLIFEITDADDRSIQALILDATNYVQNKDNS